MRNCACGHTVLNHTRVGFPVDWSDFVCLLSRRRVHLIFWSKELCECDGYIPAESPPEA